MATLNETSGVLTSPYYPRRYPSNEKCSWKIIASKEERILLFIEDIHIANCGSSCTCDYLEIHNGSSSDDIPDRRRCRYYTDRGIVYHSVKDVLRVTFVSDRPFSSGYRGFRAIYITVKKNATTTGKLLESSFKRKVRGLLCRRSGDQLSTKLYEILLPYNRLIVSVIFKYFTEVKNPKNVNEMLTIFIGFKSRVKGLCVGDQLSTKLYEILSPYNGLIVTVIFKYLSE